MYQGVAHGGPLTGRQLVSRKPGGLLVVDRPANLAYVYVWIDGGFWIREDYQAGLPLDYDRRIMTAESEGWDVIAWTAGD